MKPVEWGLCLPDCPSQEVEIVCKDLPPFPALADLSENPKSVNYTIKGILPNRTTNIVIPGVSGNKINKIKLTTLTRLSINQFLTWLQMSYISFSCPEGYIFEDSNNATNYAFCFNTTFDVQYDPKKYCVRK